MAIFSIIIGAALGVFSSTLKNQRNILARQQVLGEMSYALEYMSRSMRMAKKDDLDGVHCLVADKANYEITPELGIQFRNYNNVCQKFFLEDEQLKEDKAGVILALTSDSIRVTKFSINLSGEQQPPSDNLQPAATILLEITNSDNTIIQFQTTLSQRDLDVQY